MRDAASRGRPAETRYKPLRGNAERLCRLTPTTPDGEQMSSPSAQQPNAISEQAETPAYRPPDMSLAFDEHVARYIETDGREGHDWNGATCLVLGTTGRRSGEPRTNALIYSAAGDEFIVIASKGGSPNHPAWYLNLQANPEVDVQVCGDRFKARARTATGAERAELWRLANVTWPNYDVYATRTDREIPVVVLSRIPQRPGETRP
jgi:deazaflavin-dependent oxidoreductase (nitroreductase family)